MARYITALTALTLLVHAAAGCAPSPRGKDDRPLAVYEVAGDSIYTVDQWGSRNPFKYSHVNPGQRSNYLDLFLTVSYLQMFTLTRDMDVTLIDFTTKLETARHVAFPGSPTPRVARFGWAGQRLYILMKDDSNQWEIGSCDVYSGDTAVLAGPLNGLGPGLDSPASFDLASGGHQAWVLYSSGLMAAYNIYGNDATEGVIADFGPGAAADLHVTQSDQAFAGGDDGIYSLQPGDSVRSVSSMPGVKLLSLRDPSVKQIWAVNLANELYRVDVASGAYYPVMKNPEQVSYIATADYHWVRNTRPVIYIYYSDPPYTIDLTGFGVEPFFYDFLDPDGEAADVTLNLSADPAQNMYLYYSGDSVAQFPAVSPGSAGILATFNPGTVAGPFTFRVEAFSEDGQVSIREDHLTTQ